MGNSTCLPKFEVYALKFAYKISKYTERFIEGDPHDLDVSTFYYVWLLRNSSKIFLVDTGFDANVAKERNRIFEDTPINILKLMGFNQYDFDDVIITHLHNDHAGMLSDFPSAKFHLQDAEIKYATGRHMRSNLFRHPYDIEHIAETIKLVYADRVKFYNGDAVISPGLSVHHIGGHTMGLQVVRVHTNRGWIVLASDASHFYQNIKDIRPHPIVFNVAEMVEGYSKIIQLADSVNHIIPGHDPLVMKIYPDTSFDLKGVSVRLDLDPIEDFSLWLRDDKQH
jgi:glyoxylase-like metal-dependent hydrolase (beta-lactamase superfamily II)